MSTTDEQNTDAAISALYESVMAPDTLSAALAAIGRMLDIEGLSQWRISKVTGEFEYFERVGHEDATAQAYAAYYRHLDPAAEKGIMSPVGTWVIERGAVDPRLASHREYFHDFCVPHRIGGIAGAKIFESETALVAFGAQRRPDQPEFGSQRERLNRLLPHLMRAESLRDRFRMLTEQRSELARALDAFAGAVLVVDRHAVVRFANASGARCCAAPDGALRVSNRRLLTRNPEMQSHLNAALATVLGKAPRAAAFMIPRGLSAPVQVLLTPLTTAQREAMASAEPLALVAVEHDDPPHDVATLRALFGLTPAEARVAHALADGEDVQAIHLRTGTTVATLRTQVAKIFQKCGVSSQTQLAARIRRLPTLRS